MKGTGAKRNVCPGSCVSTGAKFPVAPVESAPMIGGQSVETETALLNVLSDRPWSIFATATAKNFKLNGTSWPCVVLALCDNYLSPKWE